MPTPTTQRQKLSIFREPHENVDQSGLDELNATVQDAYVNELKQTEKRPGLQELCDLGTTFGVDGLFWWNQKGVVLAVSAGRVWKITDLSGSLTELTGATLSTGTRVTFATNGTLTVMANGANMVHTDNSALTQMADADAPTAVTHVAFLDSYIMANSVGTARTYYSDLNSVTAWTSTSFFTAESNPDNATAMKVGWREVLVAGNESVEVWINDGQTPFSRLQGGIIQRGCSAPYTIQQVGNAWMWLDDRRKFVKLDGRDPTVISLPYDRVIQEMTAVDNAISDVIEVSGFPLYVTSFPSAGVTLVYNYLTESWSRWGYWDGSQGVYQRFLGNSYCYARGWNFHLFGDRTTGKIYKASRDVFTDDGNPIRSTRQTGFISHGTNQMKECVELTIRLKRSVANATVTDPQMMVRWRNKNGAWNQERQVSLGQVGDHDYLVHLHRLGQYRVRQWEFTHSDATDWILVDAEEEFEVLDS